MIRSIVKALKPGGRLILLEYRGEDPEVPIKPRHKMTEKQSIREMEAAGLKHKETLEFLPTQHFMVFVKPGKYEKLISLFPPTPIQLKLDWPRRS